MKCGLCFKGFFSLPPVAVAAALSVSRRPQECQRWSVEVGGGGAAAGLCSAVSRPHPLPPSVRPSLGPSLPPP